MGWRIAKASARLRDQVDAAYPKRSRKSDGVIGDASHSSRTSDHNPNAKGVVCAIDITDDKANGCDVGEIFANIKGDSRVHYAIHDRRISNEGGPWTAYHGSSPHTAHGHLSLRQVASRYDDARDWAVKGAPAKPRPKPKPKAKHPAHPQLAEGSKGTAVKHLQARLIAHGFGLKPDGDFGPYTDDRVRDFQADHGLKRDGIVGKRTWAELC